jgi:hypothetical protein
LALCGVVLDLCLAEGKKTRGLVEFHKRASPFPFGSLNQEAGAKSRYVKKSNNIYSTLGNLLHINYVPPTFSSISYTLNAGDSISFRGYQPKSLAFRRDLAPFSHRILLLPDFVWLFYIPRNL